METVILTNILHTTDVTSVVYNIGKYNIFHTPDTAILFVLEKACLCLQILLLFIILENFVLLININKKNEKLTFTWIIRFRRGTVADTVCSD